MGNDRIRFVALIGPSLYNKEQRLSGGKSQKGGKREEADADVSKL